MNTQELKEFDESYQWWGDFLEARKEALFAMKRLGFSYQDMQEQLNFNWYDKASEQIQQDHTDGLISDSEYYQQIRDLDAEYQEYVQQEVDSYRDSFY